jgi:hypothetical protein
MSSAGNRRRSQTGFDIENKHHKQYHNYNLIIRLTTEQTIQTNMPMRQQSTPFRAANQITKSHIFL